MSKRIPNTEQVVEVNIISADFVEANDFYISSIAHSVKDAMQEIGLRFKHEKTLKDLIFVTGKEVLPEHCEEAIKKIRDNQPTPRQVVILHAFIT